MQEQDRPGDLIWAAKLADAAWAAGLFDGEGCINNYARGKKQGVQIRLAMSDRDLVERFARIVGAGDVHRREHASTEIHDRSHWKPMYEVYVYEAAEVARIIEMLLPWLGERRHTRALEVLAICQEIGVHKGKRTHCPQGHPYAGANLMVEPIHRGSNGKVYPARRCRICRTEQARNRKRRELGITPDRFRIKE